MHNSSQKLRKELQLELFVNLTLQCYKEVSENHSDVLQDADFNGSRNEIQWCPRTFDGFSCWDETPAASTAVQLCPSFIVGFDPRRQVYKRCTENGTWFTLPGGRRPWTNYTTCVDMEDLSFRNLVNNIYVVGYSLSVAALVLSMIVFIYFKTLHCTRIKIHLHLFSSFTVNGILWITWFKTVVSFVSIVQENYKWCQILHVVMNYFTVASYMWMFCEALHLHIALIVVFIKDEIAMRWFMAVGWGLPLIITTVYAVVRAHTPEDTQRCWMDHSDTFWIITIPVLISLVVSFVFLVNIVRVLLTKLPAVNNQAPVAAKKAVRAALILIPLFGLHFILIPLRPGPDSAGEKIYQIFSAVLTSFQGLCVAILFCFTNHEVVSVARAHVARMAPAHDAMPMTGLTAGESLANTRENVL